jgi:hypothetical protein
MMAANLAGYGVDGAGALAMLRRVFAAPRFVAAMLTTFFCAAHLMFFLRIREATAAMHRA